MTDYKKLANPSNIYRHILLEDEGDENFTSLEQREEEESPFFLPDRFHLSVPIRRQEPTPKTECNKQKKSYVMEPRLHGRNNTKTPLARPPSTLTNEMATKREHNKKLIHQNSVDDGIELNESFSGGRNSYASNFSGEWMCRLIPHQEKKSKPRYEGGEDSQQLLPSRHTAERSKPRTCFSVKGPGKNHPLELQQSSLPRRPWEVDQWHSQRMQQIDFENAQMSLPKGSWAAGHQRSCTIRETSNSSRTSVRTTATSASSQTPFEAFKEPAPFPFNGHSRERVKSDLSFADLVGQMALRETSWESELSASGPRARIVETSTRAQAKNAAIPRVVYVEALPTRAEKHKDKLPSSVTKGSDRVKINMRNVRLKQARPPVIEVDVRTTTDNDDISQITNPNFARKDYVRHFSSFVSQHPRSAQATSDGTGHTEKFDFPN